MAPRTVPPPAGTIEAEAITTIRTLAMDAVQAAHSGHPGAPMGMAPTAYVLWQRFLRYNPEDPTWPNRDRFVLSAGHASALLYSMLHLAGVKAVDAEYKSKNELAVRLEDLQRFRQLGSPTPGHPEYRWTSGVELTTGPLGQGVAGSVGMAIASRWLAATFNRPNLELFDYNVYALCGDGCLMEGISSEAASLAGHLQLANLCWIYDSNRISIEGSTDLAFTEDVGARFRAYGWNVLHVEDGNDLDALDAAFRQFLQYRAEGRRPTFIAVRTHIAYGSPNKQDTHGAHGEPLGDEEVRLTKRAYGWPEDARFLVPDAVRGHFREGIGRRGADLHAAWARQFADYGRQYPEQAGWLTRMQHRQLPEGWDSELPSFPADPKGKATRDTSGAVLNAIARHVPWLMGGSADLAPSTKTKLAFAGAGTFTAQSPAGRNLHFGVREHAMAAICNGLAVSKIRPYGSTFLIFSDYMKNSIRLSALMELPVIYIFTHDSIGVGEDGPTHQPIEQLPSLRAIPGLITIRPADAAEVVEAWKAIMPLRHEPVALILTRQAVPTWDRTKLASAAGLHQGAYVLADAPQGQPEVLLLATGSEVSLCLEAREKLAAEGIQARVVSMPSWELFEAYCKDHPGYRDEVLPPEVTARVSVEMASGLGWERYVGMRGAILGMTTFGSSAPLKDLLKKFGFTVDHVVALAREQARGKK